MAGLAIGVSSMKSGERALLHIGWELGYGNFFSKSSSYGGLGKARSDMTGGKDWCSRQKEDGREQSV
ncbi:hypothetical protein F2Q68_00002175 [Brassica cretica]|uniref:PPIase FKBP-type domain-containing protein n=1 Tax=Brassica cretica TaxID=69181 RepID=A0A8S9JHY8_BRACR|nr:hypothetical protein F2Q68_00002175 [Brassica cretica]